MSKRLDCVEHHAHDESCFRDPVAERAKRLAWSLDQCTKGWPKPGWDGRFAPAPTLHAPIALDPAWKFCPLCGTRVRE